MRINQKVNKTVLVTGSAGFMGRNLVEVLRLMPNITVLQFDITDTEEALISYLGISDIIFHIAGVNRPERVEQFIVGNIGITTQIVEYIQKLENKPLMVLSSSIQAEIDNPYGRSKFQAEQLVEQYCAAGGKGVIFRLPNVYGKWSLPNYNSVVATFCYNIANGLNITISDPQRIINLVYIDDVVSAFIGLITEDTVDIGIRYLSVEPVTKISLNDLSLLIYRLRDVRSGLLLPDMNERFHRCLYATYLSFLAKDEFAYKLSKREDQRGSLAELLKSPHFGQIFISRTNPGHTRGNHFHHTKVEKFCVVEGEAVIRFRNILSNDVISYVIRGEEFTVVDIPPGYTHSIENTGARELVVLFWSSELFNAGAPDTHPFPVL